jgi:hypothetical protein
MSGWHWQQSQQQELLALEQWRRRQQQLVQQEQHQQQQVQQQLLYQHQQLVHCPQGYAGHAYGAGHQQFYAVPLDNAPHGSGAQGLWPHNAVGAVGVAQQSCHYSSAAPNMAVPPPTRQLGQPMPVNSAAAGNGVVPLPPPAYQQEALPDFHALLAGLPRVQAVLQLLK